MDYVKDVICEEKVPIAVVLRWGAETATLRKKGNSIAIDNNKRIAPSQEISKEMLKQARAILFGFKSKKKKKQVTISTRNMLPETRSRVEALKLVRAEITVDGKLMISERSGRVYFYPSIDKAISGSRKTAAARSRELEDLSQALGVIARNLNLMVSGKQTVLDIESLRPVYALLKNCTDDFKASAAKVLDALIRTCGKHVTKNLEGTVEMLRSVANLLSSRIAVLPAIIDFFDKRLETLVEENENLFNQIESAMSALKPILNSGDGFLKNQLALGERLDKVAVKLRSVWLEPYRNEANLCLSYIAKIKKSKMVAKKRSDLVHVRSLLGIIAESRKEEGNETDKRH